MANWRAHPEETDLLRHSDGELRPRDSMRIARHLEACWDCRTKLDDLNEAIAEYVRFRRNAIEPAMPPPPRPWKDLRLELDRRSESAAPQSPWRRILERRSVWLLAGALAAGTGVFLYHPKQRAPETVARPAAASAPAPMPAPPFRRTAPLPPKPSPPGPEDELRVIAALDRIGADLGDPVEVSRGPNRIAVVCMGLSPQRADEVRAALHDLPQVALEFSPRSQTPSTGAPLQVAGAPHATAGNVLSGKFESPAAYDRFVDGLLRTSEGMMARAHALRNLALRFPPGVEAALTADGRKLLDSIRLGHESALTHEVAMLNQALQPFVSPPVSYPERTSNPQPWQTRQTRIFTDAEQVDRGLSAFFAGTQGASAQPASLASVAAALANLKTDVDVR